MICLDFHVWNIILKCNFLLFFYRKYDFSLSRCGSTIFTDQLSLLNHHTPAQSTYPSYINHYFCTHHNLISLLPQDDPFSYPECHFLLMHLHHSIYLSPGGNFLLVSYPVLPDQYFHCNKYLHRKYLLCCHSHIHIPSLCFLLYILFAVNGSLLSHRHKKN